MTSKIIPIDSLTTCLIFFPCSMTVAMAAQARWEMMDRADVFYTGVVLMVLGTVLVVSSFLSLGFTGTFLGNYQTLLNIKAASLNNISLTFKGLWCLKNMRIFQREDQTEDYIMSALWELWVPALLSLL